MFPFLPPIWLLSPCFSSSLTPSVYTSGGGGVGSGYDSGEGKKKFVSYDSGLGTEPGMTTCSSCQQQVMTNVTYKAGTYAWLMCLLFICCGWVFFVLICLYWHGPRSPSLSKIHSIHLYYLLFKYTCVLVTYRVKGEVETKEDNILVY